MIYFDHSIKKKNIKFISNSINNIKNYKKVEFYRKIYNGFYIRV